MGFFLIYYLIGDRPISFRYKVTHFAIKYLGIPSIILSVSLNPSQGHHLSITIFLTTSFPAGGGACVPRTSAQTQLLKFLVSLFAPASRRILPGVNGIHGLPLSKTILCGIQSSHYPQIDTLHSVGHRACPGDKPIITFEVKHVALG